VGFFVRAYEANLYKPSHEIEEIYTGLRKQLEAIAKDITQQLNQTFERILADNTATKKTVDRITQESEARADARIGKMQEEIDRLKKENVKHEREKDDLRHEMREAKSFKKETADVLKVVGASIGLVAVILTQFKPKKKGTTTSM
jgi:chromosome segregation ATPase